MEEGFDGGGGLAAGAKLEDLAEQDERGDSGGGFEVDSGSADGAEGVGEDRGATVATTL